MMSASSAVLMNISHWINVNALNEKRKKLHIDAAIKMLEKTVRFFGGDLKDLGNK